MRITQRPTPNVSERRCTQCGLRLHARLVTAGITEHVLCTTIDARDYDALLVERYGPAKALERERRRARSA